MRTFSKRIRLCECAKSIFDCFLRDKPDRRFISSVLLVTEKRKTKEEKKNKQGQVEHATRALFPIFIFLCSATFIGSIGRGAPRNHQTYHRPITRLYFYCWFLFSLFFLFVFCFYFVFFLFLLFFFYLFILLSLFIYYICPFVTEINREPRSYSQLHFTWARSLWRVTLNCP